MVDRRMGLGQAMSASYHRVVDNGFWEHLALIVVFFAIGAVANGWVGIITTPFTIAVIVGAYFASRDYDRQYIAAPAAPAPLPPAPLTTPEPPAPMQTAVAETASAETAVAETATTTTEVVTPAAPVDEATATDEAVPTDGTDAEAAETPEGPEETGEPKA